MMQTLSGRFLVASPEMKDPAFAQTVIFIAGHQSAKGAVGMVINRPANVSLAEVYRQLGIENDEQPEQADHTPIGWGGPVQSTHGYILHSVEQHKTWDVTIYNGPQLTVTASPDIVYAYARGEGPERAMIVLGCAAWDPGQLEEEIAQKWWMTAAIDTDIIFSMPMSDRYDAALALVGLDDDDMQVKPSAFTTHLRAGHA